MGELRESGDHEQVGVGDALRVGEREAAQRGEVLDERDAGAGFEAFAELQGFEWERGDMLECQRGGLRSAEFEAFQFGELGEVRGARVGELRVGEAEAFEIGQVFAQQAEAFVVDGTTAVADAGHLGEARELRVGLAGDLRSDDGEVLQILQAGELRHAGIGDLAVVGKAERLEIRELGDGRHPLVVELGRDDIQRFQRGEMADMHEEGCIIGVVLAMVVRSGARHVEIDELHALAIGGQLHLALRGGDDAGHGFGMRIEGEGGRGEE